MNEYLVFIFGFIFMDNISVWVNWSYGSKDDGIGVEEDKLNYVFICIIHNR